MPPVTPTLDWKTISVTAPVPNWNGLQPDARMVGALVLQMLGNPSLEVGMAQPE